MSDDGARRELDREPAHEPELATMETEEQLHDETANQDVDVQDAHEGNANDVGANDGDADQAGADGDEPNKDGDEAIVKPSRKRSRSGGSKKRPASRRSRAASVQQEQRAALMERVAEMRDQPLSAFMLFAFAQRPSIKRQKPNAAPREIAKLMGERWTMLSDEQRRGYEKMAVEGPNTPRPSKEDLAAMMPRSPAAIKKQKSAKKAKASEPKLPAEGKVLVPLAGGPGGAGSSADVLAPPGGSPAAEKATPPDESPANAAGASAKSLDVPMGDSLDAAPVARDATDERLQETDAAMATERGEEARAVGLAEGREEAATTTDSAEAMAV